MIHIFERQHIDISTIMNLSTVQQLQLQLGQVPVSVMQPQAQANLIQNLRQTVPQLRQENITAILQIARQIQNVVAPQVTQQIPVFTALAPVLKQYGIPESIVTLSM